MHLGAQARKVRINGREGMQARKTHIKRASEIDYETSLD